MTQVDDTCGGGNKDFSSLEADKSKAFNCKPRNTTFPMKFNGIWIEKSKLEGYETHQYDYCQSIEELEPSF